ncbi:hypothetical protein M413DRAFT_439207 [Hebeloma cylindrosporum]|uniref:non-specific serine/threonine protein kinase n=1 Tax=Hebeloma cylindrosporum TaxID=76867 RepID=A0A0C2Z2P3_HEBCY|nr:hypothetical protein M413DRAFT_439207 [Hebeloma cylindrosporum h7]
MANQQAYHAYPQNKGTLIPGQTISVNNYTVQVERYLSQGGFAHVYLVRTPAPVYNTTHHVLKRIAVANETMLTEVKKEVDIMRLLKGHPNIVHLIDAAWHKLPNGTFEVFILMEYCPGGGIIDMMNRRLRERLTEGEILQIFVDVCEGVAYMHNSRPPLLHRDLKVENILQSSPTSFKLCDFGSATTVSNPPTNMQEIRALEADLNRHTTLQYRAPEMVDVHSKRPVNEKSDVWALGVLLYRLCYYTTPFEEHGPLAILNVQYRTPPYPVYSQDMKHLIDSMLREHGSQRPTVFDLLNHVHRLRGTKSKFAYNIPVPPPLLPHGHPQAKFSPPLNPLDGLVTYGFPPAKSALSIYDMNAPSNPPNQGVQAREKVLEAIAPMRRGRPTASKESLSTSRPPTPPNIVKHSQSRSEYAKDWSDSGFGPEQDRAWKDVTEKHSSSSHARPPNASDEAWNLGELDQNMRREKKDRPTGFGDDFAQKLWNSQDPNSPTPRLSPRPNVNALKPNDTHVTPLIFTGTSKIRPKQDRLQQKKDKDAFEGLGLTSTAPKTAPTLGEARKLRTGLATLSTSTNQGDYRQLDKAQPNVDRPSPSPQPRYLSTTPVHTQSISPVPTPGNSSFKLSPYATSMARVSPSASAKADGPIESRFPSLEELDAQFKPTANSLYPSSVIEATPKYVPQSAPATRQSESRSFYSSRTSNIGSTGTGGNLLTKPATTSTISSHSVDGVRSQQVTGIAMRESKESRRADDLGAEPKPSELERDNGDDTSRGTHRNTETQQRPMLVRKHRSSVTMKLGSKAETPDSNDNLDPPKLPPRPSATTPSRDWLTGDDHNDISANVLPSDVPILRESPSKRASFVEKSDFRIPSSTAAQHEYAPQRFIPEPQSADLSPTVSNFKRAFPAIEKFDAEPQATEKSFSSVPKESRSPPVPRKDVDVDSSSADEGPEDPRSIASSAQKRQVARGKGRQSSVHELAYQFGGSLPAKEKEKEKEKGREWQPSPYSVGDYVPRKARLSLAPPASTSVQDRKTPSPTNYSFNRPPSATSNYPHRQQSAAPEEKSQPSLDAKSAAPSRSRPQSMFIFPSKSVDSSSTPTSNNLAPPQEPKPRAVRRTSISDMVQKYEAIGGARASAKSPNTLAPGPPSPIHRPISAKSNSASAENGRVHNSFADKKPVLSSKTSLSSDIPSRSTGGDPSKPRATVKEPVRQATQLSRTPTKTHNRTASEKGKSTVSQGADSTPRPRRISVKAEPATTKSTFVRTDTGAGRPSKLESSGSSSSPRKPLISLTTEEGTAKVEEPPRSPSPERPYQGVGRLIDQWQKKSAEAEQGRPGSKFVPKRAGTIQVDDR